MNIPNAILNTMGIEIKFDQQYTHKQLLEAGLERIRFYSQNSLFWKDNNVYHFKHIEPKEKHDRFKLYQIIEKNIMENEMGKIRQIRKRHDCKFN